MLRVGVGLSAEATGRALDMSPGAVRVAQHRALAKTACAGEPAGRPAAIVNDLPGVHMVSAGAAPDVAVLIETDELLDRIGRRAHAASDLGDPVLASLAVLAADVDLDPAPVERTRRAALERALWLLDRQWHATGTAGSGCCRRSDSCHPADHDALPTLRGATSPWPRPRCASARNGRVRTPVRAVSFEPRPRPGGRRPPGWYPGWSPPGAALVLSMTAAAAITRGESVNPAAALAHVVRGLSGEAREPAPSRFVVGRGRGP